MRRRTKVGRALLAFALLLGGPTLNGVAVAAPTRAEVERLLSAYEPTGAADALVRLGPGVDRALIAIASDGRVSRLRRGRALRALGRVPSAAGRALLREVVRAQRAATSGPDAMDLIECAYALGGFGSDGVADLVPLLTHPLASVRVAAASGLAATGVEEARALLAERLAVEPDAEARVAIARLVAERAAR